jgi:hypothetical protein
MKFPGSLVGLNLITLEVNSKQECRRFRTITMVKHIHLSFTNKSQMMYGDKTSFFQVPAQLNSYSQSSYSSPS